jgi:tetratricopeptide (TPR) repeat protein
MLMLVGCGTMKPATKSTDRELNRVSGLARSAYEAGQYEEAVKLYGRALNRARAMDAFGEIGNSAYNLAVSETALGQYDDARIHLREARVALERSRKDPVDTLVLESQVAYRQAKYVEAVELADEGLRSLQKKPNKVAELQLIMLKADVAIEQTNVSLARAFLDSARGQVKKDYPAWLIADEAKMRGQVALLEGGAEEAAQEFDREVGFRKKAKQYGPMSEALVRAGNAYKDAGVFERAADRYLRGARSMKAQDNQAGALKVAERALEMARKAGGKEQIEEAEALLDKTMVNK